MAHLVDAWPGKTRSHLNEYTLAFFFNFIDCFYKITLHFKLIESGHHNECIGIVFGVSLGIIAVEGDAWISVYGFS